MLWSHATEKELTIMDPLSLGRKLSVLLQELVDGNSKVSNWFAPHSKKVCNTVEKWKTPETCVEQFFPGHWEKGREIGVLTRARTVATEVGENFEMAAMLNNAMGDQVEGQIWMRAALNKAEEILCLKEQLKEAQAEVEIWRTEAETLAMKCVDKDLAIEALNIKLDEDRIWLQRAHQTECEALTLKAQRTEAFLKRRVFENLLTALRDMESEYCQLVDELSETSLRSQESEWLPRGVKREASDVPELPQENLVDLEDLENYVDETYKRRRLFVD